MLLSFRQDKNRVALLAVIFSTENRPQREQTDCSLRSSFRSLGPACLLDFEKHSPSPSCKEKFFAQELSYLRYEYSKKPFN